MKTIPKILTVDDSKTNLFALEKILSPLNADIHMAHSGEEALSHVLRHEFALALLDVQMGGMDGFETASLIRANRLSRNLPIIFVTAISKEKEYVFKGYEAGAVDYLLKPYNPDILVSKVRVFLELYCQKKRLEEAKNAVEEEKAKIVSIVRSIPTGLIMLDKNRQVSYINPYIEDFLEVTEDAEVFAIDKQYILETKQLDLDKLADEFEKSGASTYVTEVHLDIPDERIFSITLANAVEENSNSGILVSVKDVTSEKAVEKLKTEFMANISHELRTPMTSIKNAISIVAGKVAGELNIQQEKFLAMATHNIDRLARLINSVLDFSKLEATTNDSLNKENIELSELVDTVITSFEPQASHKNIRLYKDVEYSALEISADVDKLEQVLVNLVSNAIKFTPSGGKIRIGIIIIKKDMGHSIMNQPNNNQQADNIFYKILVGDNGIGIPKDKLGYIFDRFKQVEDGLSYKSQGTGLGLAICKKIIELHGGDIGVESIEGKGSTFWFTLPVNLKK